MKREDFNTLPTLVWDYIKHLERSIHSEHTILEYASDLRLFFRFVAERRSLIHPDAAWDELDLPGFVDRAFIASVTVSECSEFISYCRSERKNNARTLARRFVSVKRFFRYLTVQRHILENNPMDELDSQRTGKTLPKYLTLEDCHELLQAVISRDEENPFRERDFCILILFLNCGMRLSELVGLNVTDLRKDLTVCIHGKGNKERTVYLNEACLSALEHYLKVRPQDRVKAPDRDALFISRNNRRINQRSVQLMLDKYLEKSGLNGQGYSIHKLRHTAATLMYQNDVDVLQLKEILGHENLSTTQIYTHVIDQQLRAAMDANPLSQVKEAEL
jgi:site-specific recombinase XerD